MNKLLLAVLFASAGLLEGCGPPALSCQTQTCTTGSGKTYQLCVNIDASETWNFGGMSCHASTTDTSGVMNCTNEVATYCGGGAGGTGGTGGGGGSGGTGGSTPCTFTVSGAQTASGTCTAQAAYSASKGVVMTVTTNSGTLNYAASFTSQTTLTDGTYGNSNAAPGFGAEFLVGTMSAWEMCSDSQNCGMIPPQGTFSLTITDPGPSTTVNGDTLWMSPQGMLTLTLPFAPNTSATGTVTVTVTL